MERLSEIISVDPKGNHMYLYKREAERELRRERGRQRGHGGRGWDCAAARQGAPAAPQGRRGKRPLPRTGPEGIAALLTPGFQPTDNDFRFHISRTVRE